MAINTKDFAEIRKVREENRAQEGERKLVV